MNSFIAYLDFVGTKGTAFVSGEYYRENIKTIIDTLSDLSEKYKSVKTTMLSDSVFISSKNKEIFDYLRQLRNALFYKDIFFVCVVIKGKFGLESEKNKRFSYHIFREPDTIKVYVQQALLKGIAIDISQLDKKNDYGCVESYFANDSGLIKISDLSYVNPISDKQDHILKYYEKKLDTIFKAAYQQALINSNAAKYYLAPYISILNSAISQNADDIIKSLLKHALELFNKQYIKDNNTLSFMFAFLIDCILTFNDNTDEDIEFIKGIQSNNFFISLMKQLNLIPLDLISAKHKRELLDIHYKLG